MKSLMSVFLIVGSLAFPGGVASAGECVGTVLEYVMTLEHLARFPPEGGPEYGDLWEAFDCLAQGPEDHSRWAGPVAARRYAGLRQSPMRPRIVAACSEYLDQRRLSGPYDQRLAFKAAYALAMYGVPRVGSHDILSVLVEWTRGNREELPYFALAAIGDRRVLSLLEATYDSLSALPGSDQVRDEKVQLVNCLYHIRGDSVLAFVKSIAANESDSLVVGRARRVLATRLE